MFQSQPQPKRLHQNVLNGHQGEQLVSARAASMGFAFHGLNRLETGVDGMMELRDPLTHAMLAKWVGVQVKTTVGGSYTGEDEQRFEYLLEPADLAYWGPSNIPMIIVLVRLSDHTMFWKAVNAGRLDEPRRLDFDKAADVFDAKAADAIAALTIEKNTFGTYVPPMLAGEPAHLNLVRMVLPEEIFVAESPFKSGREAVKEMLLHDGPMHFDWVIRDRTFWSFRDPRGTVLEEIVDVGSVEAVETEAVVLLDDVDDQNAVIELLRRSVEAQLSGDCFFDKETRGLCFRAPGPGMKREYVYRSLQNVTSADVVTLIGKEGRDDIMRHHAFVPRYQRIGDEWFMSITPTFVFTSDGYRTHPASSIMLAGKKKLEKAGAIRGQFIMWRHLLIASATAPAPTLLDDPAEGVDDRPRIGFEPLEPLSLPVSVPEDVWREEDPEEAERVAQEGMI
ncbi:hypothetical protein GGR88_000606 [Sphingomonas jejuensis]|uniref:DUF4365 domain-containing protein n=1 Tax=Sphingomonas jejuensis TaxID=904715 RepID=A0ABX0XIG6_9SPHN|nr:DUF4365 domain-containing protein [Sphingomonas jejuensis]NJC33132.1 hypothetical protein [Sphingomonas jejuensis]